MNDDLHDSVLPGAGRTMMAAVLGAATMLGCGSASATSTTVLTDKGQVAGTQLSGSSPAINAFLGIPYAAPPVGALRFKPPQPHAAWTTPIQTTKVAAPCPQVVPQTGAAVGSEDCLYLNVYAPAGAASSTLPVMVFLPGGSFTGGSASSPYYNGQSIAEQGNVIVVTVTYRVGALGFLTAPALDAESSGKVSGNYGIEDQQAALRWVRANIAGFGGNPQNVTLFGESAGANSVEDQLTSPAVAGLFRKAIIESSVGAPGIPDLTLAQSEAGPGATFVSNVGCAGASSIASCLRAASVSSILSAQADATTYPVVDGAVIPLAPLAAFQSGKFNQVPLITGSNHDEFTTLIAGAFPQAENPPLTNAAYTALLHGIFGGAAPLVQAQYPASAYQSPLQAFATLGTDGFVVCQIEQKRAALSKYVEVFGYEFNEPNPAQGPIFGPPITGLTYGDYHTAELPYVFGYTAPGGIAVTGKDLALSKSVITYWTNFATATYPSATSSTRTPVWPQYAQSSLLSLTDQVATLALSQFNTNHKSGSGPLGGPCGPTPPRPGARNRAARVAGCGNRRRNALTAPLVRSRPSSGRTVRLPAPSPTALRHWRSP